MPRLERLSLTAALTAGHDDNGDTQAGGVSIDELMAMLFRVLRKHPAAMAEVEEMYLAISKQANNDSSGKEEGMEEAGRASDIRDGRQQRPEAA